jgi:DNA replication protein DnaC
VTHYRNQLVYHLRISFLILCILFFMQGSSLGQRTFSVNKNAARNIKDSINKNKEDVIEDKNDDYSEKEENNGRNEYTWLSMLSVVASLPPKQIQKIDFLTNSGGSGENNAVSWIDFNGYEEIKEKIQRIIRGMKKQKSMKKLNPDNTHIKNNPTAGNLSEIASNSKNLSLKASCNSVCGIVLYGPSGCGKTYLSRIIAAEVGTKRFLFQMIKWNSSSTFLPLTSMPYYYNRILLVLSTFLLSCFA